MVIMQQQVKVVRTKLADALIGAVHSSINAGHNTGRLGRLVLTAEAKGVGIKHRIRQTPALLKKEVAA
jgi:acyl-coenzyme A synthetase/AMP-(fatty) acid ligase